MGGGRFLLGKFACSDSIRTANVSISRQACTNRVPTSVIFESEQVMNGHFLSALPWVARTYCDVTKVFPFSFVIAYGLSSTNPMDC